MLQPRYSNRTLKAYRKFKLTLAILFFLFPTFPVHAEDAEFRNVKEESVHEYVFKSLPRNLLIGTKESLWGWNLAALGAAAGVAIPLSQTDADEEIQDAADGSLGDDLSKIGNIGGDGLTLAGIAASTYILGKVIKDEKVTETGEALIEAQIIRAVMTKLIKVSVGRERPNGRDDRFSSSFPSGHASGTFALASTVDYMYGHKIGIPLYLFAAFSSYSRLSEDKHFLSDVLFGAVLGTVIGRAVAKIHKDENHNRFSILPYSDSDSAGLVLVVSW